MSSFIGKKFSINAANSFVSSFRNESVYLYYGKVDSWPVEASPPSADDTVKNHNKIWDSMVGAIRVTPDRVHLGIERNDWVSGSKYTKYDHANTSLSNFYVLAGAMDRDVYKCLDNNGETRSSVKPTHKNLGATKEKDGYVWKYMYSISNYAFTHFATATVLPVATDLDVSSFSKPGGIINLPISANNITGVGQNYRGTGFSNGTSGISAANATIFSTISASSSTNEIQVAATSGLAIFDDYYVNSAFLVTSGKAKGTYRLIVDSKASGFSGSDDKRSNLVLSSVVSNFSNGDTFIIGPRIRINDIDGLGFLGIGDVNSSGKLKSIDVSLVGFNYANGDSEVLVSGDYLPTTNGFSDGMYANVSIIIPPPNGHGFNPAMELNAKYIIVSPETPVVKDHETGRFAGYGNEIRQVGLILNPIDRRTAFAATDDSYDQRTTVYLNALDAGNRRSIVVKFAKDQKIYNRLTSGSETASGTIDNICGEAGLQYLSLTGVRGSFITNNILYNRLGDEETVSSGDDLEYYEYPLNSGINPISAVVSGGLTKYTGEVLYHENISPVTRRLDQKENFKFIFEF